MIRKFSRLSCMMTVLLLVHSHTDFCFSIQGMCGFFSIAPVAVLKRLVRSVACLYWSNYLESHGYDIESQQREVRRGTCSLALPSYITQDVPIAEATVPTLVRKRIDALRQGRYDWPTCKPILLTGQAGTGKTQLARYIARQSQCPFMYTAAAGYMSRKGNSGVETVYELFKRSRVRSEFSAWQLRITQLFALLFRRVVPRKKPTIILIDEFDAISKPAGKEPLGVNKDIEVERDKTFARLLWEIADSEYSQGESKSHLRCPPVGTLELLLLNKVILPKLKRERVNEADRQSFAEECMALRQKKIPWWLRWINGQDRAEAFVVATTNHSADELDPKVKAWFDIVEMKPFEYEERKAIFEFHGRNKKFQNPEILSRLAEMSEGWSADHMATLLNKAACFAAVEHNGVIEQGDIDKANSF